MKAFFGAMAIALCIIIVTAVFVFSYIDGRLTDKVSSTVSKKQVTWYVGLYGEKVALFEEGSDMPSQIFERPASTLRDYDRKMLEQGLYTSDYDTAMRYVEEFTS